MKKIILFAVAAIMAAVVSAQTVSTSSITFANCTTEYVNETINVGELELPFTYNGVPYVKSDFNDEFKVVSVNNTTNEKGCDKIVTTTIQLMPGVLVSKPFQVGANKYVYFSMGNLQYRSKDKTFKFADEQYIAFKNTANNESRSTSSDNYLDLFWHGRTGVGSSNDPTLKTANSSAPANLQKNTTYDYGYANKISNGGNATSIWYMLTGAEWEYLLNSRPHASEKKTFATVAQYEGILLLPEDWTDVDGVTIEPTMKDFTTNNISGQNWDKLQAAGAIFLPFCGMNANNAWNWTSGLYLTATKNSSFQFHADYLEFREVPGWAGAVRLVREAPAPQQ